MHQVEEFGDPSVLDLFWYFNQHQRQGDEGNMGDHLGEIARAKSHYGCPDPGFVTIKACSDVAGLQVFDVAAEEWIDVEEVHGTQVGWISAIMIPVGRTGSYSAGSSWLAFVLM